MTVYPLPAHDRVVFFKPLVSSSNIVVGAYTYYDDPDGATGFEHRNVLYGYGPERLIIGKYCAIASGTRFLMAGADHPTMGVSTFPFTMFGGEWAERTLDIVTAMPQPRRHRRWQRRLVRLPVHRHARRGDRRRGHHRGRCGGHR